MRRALSVWIGPAARVGACALVLLLAACGTLYKEATNLSEASADTVVVVGRIELVPPLKPKEQNIKMGSIDPFDAKGFFLHRAVLHLADRPNGGEPTQRLINPVLGQTYFFRIPRDKRYMVWGSVLLYHDAAGQKNELLVPAPFAFDIKQDDRAIYVGTWRLHRDEFNEVVKVEVVDHYGTAASEFKQRFGGGAPLRKAIGAPPQSRR